MRFGDLLAASLGSLWQRKFRTFMTVSGVVIGTLSVVVMVSLGYGMSASQFESIERQANLRQVQVMGPPMQTQPGVQAKQMDDRYLAEFRNYPGVKAAWPVYNPQIQVQVGSTTGWPQIQAMPAAAIEAMKLDVASGQLPVDGDPLRWVLGDKVQETFYDPNTGMPIPVDLATAQIYMSFDGAGGDCMGPGCPPPDPNTPKPPKKILVPTGAVLAGEPNVWTRHSQSVYVDLDALIPVLEKAYKGKAIPGQPTTPSGKPMGEFIYSMFVLETETMEDAEALNTILKEEGVQAYSEVEWIREAQRQSAMIQAVFGGIGAISLLVAAIGIANTMMMSVYERTKEIGVMKVLGASLGDIRRMFLFEASSIGFFGGLFGLLLSLAASFVINATLGQQFMGEMGGSGGGISRIPWWLMLGAVVFATLIGTVSGFVPAQRAMKLSPLAAIRSQ